MSQLSRGARVLNNTIRIFGILYLILCLLLQGMILKYSLMQYWSEIRQQLEQSQINALLYSNLFPPPPPGFSRFKTKYWISPSERSGCTILSCDVPNFQIFSNPHLYSKWYPYFTADTMAQHNLYRERKQERICRHQRKMQSYRQNYQNSDVSEFPRYSPPVFTTTDVRTISSSLNNPCDQLYRTDPFWDSSPFNPDRVDYDRESFSNDGNNSLPECFGKFRDSDVPNWLNNT